MRQIARALFSGEYLTSVDSPDTVVEIGPYPFNNSDASPLKLPRDLEVIGTEAFARSRDLVGVEFGPTIREILEGAFWTANRTEVRRAHGVQHIGNRAFSNALGFGPQLVEIPGSVTVPATGTSTVNKISDLILHEGMQVLMPNAFRDNDATAVKLPSSVIGVDQGVFGLIVASFREYYIENGQQAGTYTSDGAQWSRE